MKKFTDDNVFTDDISSSNHSDEENTNTLIDQPIENTQSNFLINSPSGLIESSDHIVEKPKISGQKVVKQAKPHRRRVMRIPQAKKPEFLLNPNMISIPRLNGEMLVSGSYDYREVTVIGAYVETFACGRKTRFCASDKQYIMVMHGPEVDYKTKFIEIRGYHSTKGIIHQISHQEWGDNFAMSTWNKTIMLMRNFPT
eukprot:157342_1